jgi:restriction system protein
VTVTIPDFQTVMLPLLRRFEDGKVHRIRNLIEPLADDFELTSEERSEMLPSGRQATFRNRVGWAASYITKAVLLERASRGQYRLTDRGRQLLESPPEQLDVDYLRRYPEFRDFMRPYTPSKDSITVPEPAPLPKLTSYDPYESLERSYRDLRSELAQELLGEIKSSPPDFFERLVIDLLVAMGYGGSRSDAAQAVGRSRDGGIDGIIKEDKLGLDAVYVQAKRWENVVGSQVVQAFAGSLEGQRARKGLVIPNKWF